MNPFLFAIANGIALGGLVSWMVRRAARQIRAEVLNSQRPALHRDWHARERLNFLEARLRLLEEEADDRVLRLVRDSEFASPDDTLILPIGGGRGA